MKRFVWFGCSLSIVGLLFGGLSAGAATTKGTALNMEVVGRHDLGNRGYNADVWVHDGHAYVGSWGFQDWAGGGENRFCPDDAHAGIVVLDTRVPSDPRPVAKLQQPTGTSAEDIVVFTARYGAFAGRDIAVSGIQTCGSSRYDVSLFRGLVVWDVTNPASPVEIGRLNTGCCTRGIHELEVQHRADLNRTFVYASVPASEYPDSASPTGMRDQSGRGDFRLIDITNPAQPVEISDWGVVHDLGGPPAAGQGCDPDPIFGHSVEPSADGRLAFVSYWDSGFVALDLVDPARPTFRGTTRYPVNADGDGHSSQYDETRRLLFTADEDFCKTSGAGIEKGFGYLRVYDYSNLGRPRQIGQYKTPNSSGPRDIGAGDYSIHNPFLVGTDVYASWYSDGVRVIDASDPMAPREVAYFVPPSANNPVSPSQRGVLTNATQVWGVVVDDATDLIYISDMNSGLWILRRT
ncbi:hypothetical protein OG394_34935 [Kribbella sp. NBC_01245]|uniref:LVIVD repeat-containing protein n=1 Tax=Kribbella sp. NBC_01245 TaxID=2903578 RepID=UPI002E2ACDBA|nr:hypothetical protein [Kribbella sp. NBC_01245]